MPQNKLYKNFKDPIHGFIWLSADELKIVDHPLFQRLRDIIQLAFCYLVYPGATHKRFEHCLGVMYVATLLFDSLIRDELFPSKQRRLYADELIEKEYWRQAIRLAALLHDIGHLPFSHTLESLSAKNHEQLTLELILSREKGGLRSIIESIKVGKYGSHQSGRCCVLGRGREV